MTLRVVELSDGWAVVVDCLVWAIGGIAIGYATHRLGPDHFTGDTWLTRARWFDRPELYERRLRIKRWKAKLPEAGGLFAGGFSKRELRPTGAESGVEHYERFVVETRRAEITHWLVLALAPWFFLWNPWWLALVMIAYGLIANAPCIAIQRYNRLRLQRVLARAHRSRPRRP